MTARRMAPLILCTAALLCGNELCMIGGTLSATNCPPE